MREAKAASSLNHPNIVTIHEIGSEGGVDFIVMELVEGRPLRAMVPPDGLDPQIALRYALQIARGLAAAHEKGIVHRDLKPENLIASDAGGVKILDFGLAKLIRPEAEAPVDSKQPTVSEWTRTGAILGTVGYMSPEQARGGRADARSDVFCLGAVLYELLTGQRAFRGDSQVETLNAILKESPDLGKVDRAAPALAGVVRRCLAKDPGERYQSGREVLLALETTEHGRLDAPGPRPRSRRPLLLAAGLAFVVLSGVAVLELGGPRALPSGRAVEPIRSIAVLPLQNLSGDPEQEYFADGMTEALITDLAQTGSLKVTSRTSVMQYKGDRRPLPEIARALGVEAVVEGSVLRAGDRVRVTAQLIDARSDRHLWAEDYERDLRDVLALQRDVARSIVREVHVALTPGEAARLAAARPVVPESHEAYLRGRFHLSRKKEESIATAIGFFEKAIAADPGSAEAHAGLASAYAERGIWGRAATREIAAKARVAALRALELDDSLAEAHAVLATFAMVYEWDWAAAERGMRRALELGGGDAEIRMRYATLLHVLGRFPEAISEVERARMLDPLSAPVASAAGRIYYRARQYDKALAAYADSLDLDPSYLPNRARLADVYLQLGRYDEALAQLEKGRAEAGETRRLSDGFGVVLAASGRRAEASEIVTRLEKSVGSSDQAAYSIALIETALGHKDRAFSWLERAYAERAATMFLLKVELKFDALRDDPRFESLLRRMNFPPDLASN